MPLFPHRTILELHTAAIRLGLQRRALLMGLSEAFVASLTEMPDTASQILFDLGTLNRIEQLLDGTVPLESWLHNAVHFAQAQGRGEVEVFQRALDGLTAGAPLREINLKRSGEPQRARTTTTILYLGASPDDKIRLALGREVREMKQRLQSASHRDQLKLEQDWAVRLSDMPSCLMRHKPAIVHFSGHGTETGELLFEDETGLAAPASPPALTELFRIFQADIRCVLLNCCYSEPQARAIAEHIDVVVGTTTAVDDEAAIAFSGAFYEALAYGKDVQTAFELGRHKLSSKGLPDSEVIKLICRAGVNAREIRFTR